MLGMRRTALLVPEFDLPAPDDLPSDLRGFLELLGGPRQFRIPGTDRSRCRAVVTLLHGNEPSGSLALLRMLREGFVPAVDLWCCVVNVAGGLDVPPQRALPGLRDQNRCFVDHGDDRPGRIAAELCAQLAALQPETILDLHNTSGSGPAYGVTIEDTPVHRALTALFGEHLMHTGLRLGTLIEGTDHIAPSLTVECGGLHQPEAHAVAYAGLCRYAAGEALDTPSRMVEVHRHPARLELRPGCTVAYAEQPDPSVDVTLRPDVDRQNFQLLVPGQGIAWLGPRGISAVRVRGEDERDRTDEFFFQDGTELRARIALRPLMVTTNAAIAASDCLFYAVRIDEEHRP